MFSPSSMPYVKLKRRSPYKKRRPYGRKRPSAVNGHNWMQYARSGAYLAEQIWKLKGLVNSEKYKFDTTVTGAVVPAGSIGSLVNVAQGDGDNARTGNSIFIRSLNWRGNVKWNTAGANVQIIRCMVFLDTQGIADTAPAVTDVIQTANVFSHLNVATVGRFKILRTFNLILNADSPAKEFEVNMPMRHHVRYNGTAGTDIQKGALFFLLITDEPGANQPTIASTCRISYHDN